MGEREPRGERALQVLQSVRCLECSSIYTKPTGGGTAAMNPGCPGCGYLGWSPVTAPPPHRSAGDHPLRPHA